jgi:hypothetical protein
MDADDAREQMLAGYRAGRDLATCPTCGSTVPVERVAGVSQRVTESDAVDADAGGG